jgi:hypothetical protein
MFNFRALKPVSGHKKRAHLPLATESIPGNRPGKPIDDFAFSTSSAGKMRSHSIIASSIMSQETPGCAAIRKTGKSKRPLLGPFYGIFQSNKSRSEVP